MLVPLVRWWADLQNREKRTVAGGATILLAGLLYLLLMPGLSAYRDLQAERQQLIGDLSWLYEQAPVVRQLQSQLQNNCVPRAAGKQSPAKPEEVVRTIGRRLQVGDLQVTSSGERGYKVTISGGDGNAVLRMSTELACAGFLLKSLQLIRAKEVREKVNGTLEFEFLG